MPLAILKSNIGRAFAVPAGTWQVTTAEHWQALALDQGWDQATLEQLAYFAHYGACSAVASTAQHIEQVRTGSRYPTSGVLIEYFAAADDDGPC